MCFKMTRYLNLSQVVDCNLLKCVFIISYLSEDM